MFMEGAALRGGLTDLRNVLCRLLPALDELCEAMVDLRRSVAAGDIQQVLDHTAMVETAAARVARVEQDRARLQPELAAHFGIGSLAAIAEHGSSGPTQQELARIVEEVRSRVARLSDEGARSRSLLSTAVDVTQEARSRLARLSGAEAAYVPSAQRRPSLMAGAYAGMQAR